MLSAIGQTSSNTSKYNEHKQCIKAREGEREREREREERERERGMLVHKSKYPWWGRQTHHDDDQHDQHHLREIKGEREREENKN